MSSRAEAFLRQPGARPFVLGHRGARHGAPENTLCAFELARSEGADGVELDVRLDGSGALIVLHDPTLERVSVERDPRHAEDVPSAELSKIDLGGGEHVPTLVDVLGWARQHEMRVNIELKSDVRQRGLLLERVRDVLQNAPLPRVILSSFDPRFVHWLGRALPNLPRAWLVHRKQRILKYAPGWRLLGDGVHFDHVLATADRIASLHRVGGVVNVWTVNDAGSARRLARDGVDGIISDRPGAILRALSACEDANP
ncbi:MAG TPA: glycerophosphodiester phosphodiesterase family protein [Polyangiaceae bacterium]|jgi:glycerophosphoryl diester phosphodiesterase